MEKFSMYTDGRTGINPFVPLEIPKKSVLSTYLFGPLLFLLRFPFILIFSFNFCIHAMVGSIIPIGIIKRIYLRYSLGMGARLLLFAMGFWWIPATERTGGPTSAVSISQRRTHSRILGISWPFLGWNLGSGDLILSNSSSIAEWLYLVFRFAPSFCILPNSLPSLVDPTLSRAISGLVETLDNMESTDSESDSTSGSEEEENTMIEDNYHQLLKTKGSSVSLEQKSKPAPQESGLIYNCYYFPKAVLASYFPKRNRDTLAQIPRIADSENQKYLDEIINDARKGSWGPLVVNPEATFSNGSGLLSFAPVFRTLPFCKTKPKCAVLAFQHGQTQTIYSIGSLFAYLYRMLSSWSNSLNVYYLADGQLPDPPSINNQNDFDQNDITKILPRSVSALPCPLPQPVHPGDLWGQIVAARICHMLNIKQTRFTSFEKLEFVNRFESKFHRLKKRD